MEATVHIEQRLVPVSFPRLENVIIESLLRPSLIVGGDFYDYFMLGPEKIAVVIGDVSGKGIPAALRMAEIKDIFQNLPQIDLSPAAIIAQANKAICEAFEKNDFVSLIYLVIDGPSKSYSYIRAGHSPLLLFEKQHGCASYLNDNGIGLGIVRNDVLFEELIFVYNRTFEAGDVLLLFTDGVDEAVDPTTQAIWGYDKLRNSFELAIRNDDTNICKAIAADIDTHVKDSACLDDMALIAVHFN